MSSLLFNFGATQDLAQGIGKGLNLQAGQFFQRRFPDQESYLRIDSQVSGRKVVVLAGLSPPDPSLMPLLQLGATLRAQGAARVILIAPYLPYMRQDVCFQPGEAISAHIFPRHLACDFDALVTVDPHLHRIKGLEEVFSGPCRVATAAPVLAAWISEHVDQPFLIGPDAESDQWVSQVADGVTQCRSGRDRSGSPIPYCVLEKTRLGDRQVEIKVPDQALNWSGTPVLVDDMISTGNTMLEAIRALQANQQSPVCVVTHALFEQEAWDNMRKAGVAKVASCNTLAHPTNAIDVSSEIVTQLEDLLA